MTGDNIVKMRNVMREETYLVTTDTSVAAFIVHTKLAFSTGFVDDALIHILEHGVRLNVFVRYLNSPYSHALCS